MNIVFGSVKTNKDASFGDMIHYIESHFGLTVERSFSSGFIGIGFSRIGNVIHYAETNDIVVVLNGYLHHPLSGWSSTKRPISAGGDSARYLLERYQERGQNFNQNVYGHYTAVVFDKKRETLFLACDPYGHCQLFIWENAGQLVFSSSLFTTGKGIPSLHPDSRYEDFFLIYGFYPNNATPYENVSSLKPGEVVQWQRGNLTRHQVAHRNPWNERFSDLSEDMREEKLISVLHEAYMDALEDQLCDQKEVAVLLGGFDSALVASALTHMGKKVETFSFYYNNTAYNQPHTDTVSKFLGSKHNWVLIDTSVIRSGLENYHSTFNRPTNWSNYVIQTVHVVEEIKKRGFENIYTGDGCDYIFYGYPLTYKRATLLRYMKMLPQPLKHAILKLGESELLDRKIGRPYHIALSMLRSTTRDWPQSSYLTFHVFDQFSLHLLKNRQAINTASIERTLEELAAPFSHLEPIRLAYTGKLALAPYRIKMAGSTDTTGIPIAAPFLHIGMKDLATNLPEKFLRPKEKEKVGTEGKYILMKMASVKKMLPDEVIYQKKVGAVDAPLVEWYSGPLRQTLLDLYTHLPFTHDDTYIQNLIKPTFAEDMYFKLISRDTSNIVTISHGLSLLATYAAFWKSGTGMS